MSSAVSPPVDFVLTDRLVLRDPGHCFNTRLSLSIFLSGFKGLKEGNPPEVEPHQQ